MYGSIFFPDPVIGKFFARVDVIGLKNLRQMNAKWKHMGFEELKKRAEQGNLKHIDFSKKDIQEKLDGFLNDTATIPQVFQSMKLHFPESIKYLDIGFFSNYSLTYLQLDISGEVFEPRSERYLLNFFTWIAPNLRELEIEFMDKCDIPTQGPLPCSPPSPSVIIFPKLESFFCTHHQVNLSKNWEMFRQFDFIIYKGGLIDPTPNLSALNLTYCEFDAEKFADFGLLASIGISRWSKLKHLTLSCDNDFEIMTATLLSLSQAGMLLESFDFAFWPSNNTINWLELSVAFSNFIATQAQSLKSLKFYGTFEEIPKEEDLSLLKIKLPAFEVLDTLTLHATHTEELIFQMGPISTNFPNLSHLDVESNVLLSMFPDGEPVNPIPLKSLIISGNSKEVVQVKDWLVDRFRSVEYFQCDGSFLDGQNLCLWKDSLKELKVGEITLFI